MTSSAHGFSQKLISLRVQLRLTAPRLFIASHSLKPLIQKGSTHST